MKTIDPGTRTRWAAAAHKYRTDPNNWLKIPEFGVKPADVNWEGFAFPIIGPVSDRLGWTDDDLLTAISIRHALMVARRLAAHEYKTLKELNEAWVGILDNIDDNDNYTLNDREGVAWAFTTVEDDLGNWSDMDRKTDRVRLSRVIRGVSLVSVWAHEGVLVARKQAEPFAHARRPILQKNLYLREIVAQYPAGRSQNERAARHVEDTAPASDDGTSPFYKVGKALMNRETGQEIEHKHLVGQIATVRKRMESEQVLGTTGTA